MSHVARPILIGAFLFALTPPANVLGQSASSASKASARPLAIEDYYRLKIVGPPEMSPDGRWVAFTVGTRIEATNGNSSQVWLVATDGKSAARRVSSEGPEATAPQWENDGRLRYTADRRRWLVDPAEPDKIIEDTNAVGRGRMGAAPAGGPPGAARQAPLLSPDGKWVAMIRDMSPPKRERK